MVDSAVVVSVLVFLLVAQAVWMAAGPAEPARGQAAERVSTYVVPMWEPRWGDGTVSIVRAPRRSRIPWLDALLDRFNLAGGLGAELLTAGVPMRAGEFVFVQLALATLFAFASLLFLSPLLGSTLSAAAGAALGFLGPLAWLRRKRSTRLNTFDEKLPDALDQVTGALRAGFGLAHGLDLVARSGAGPCSEEFGQVLHEVNLGSELDVALSRLTERIDSEDAHLLATAVAVQRRTGGNLVEVLGQLAAVIRERQRLRRDVRVITTAPRVSGYVVALLPVLTVLVMYLTSRYYVDTLFSSDVGRLAVGVSGVLVLIGLYLNHRIASLDY